MNLTQMGWECPGLHGPGTRQDIYRQTFAQVLEKYPKLIIPLFQRRYCWTESQFEKWWNDVHHGKRDHLGHHSTGNVVVKPNKNGGKYILKDHSFSEMFILVNITLDFEKDIQCFVKFS